MVSFVSCDLKLQDCRGPGLKSQRMSTISGCFSFCLFALNWRYLIFLNWVVYSRLYHVRPPKKLRKRCCVYWPRLGNSLVAGCGSTAQTRTRSSWMTLYQSVILHPGVLCVIMCYYVLLCVTMCYWNSETNPNMYAGLIRHMIPH
jgi:hypothetical protein